MWRQGSHFLKSKFFKEFWYKVSADLPREIVNLRKLQSKKLIEARKADKVVVLVALNPINFLLMEF